MRQCADTRGYVVEATAIRKLEHELEKIGETLDSVRWLIAVNEEKKFVPVVVFRNSTPHLVHLAHHGVTVIG